MGLFRDGGNVPKENVDDRTTDDLRAEVMWSPGQHVQVATVSKSRTITVTDGKQQPESSFNGWCVTLDRAGCNRMITALRKARDSAFGADA